MKTTHWDIEKAFMNVVYYGIEILIFLTIMAGLGCVDSKLAYAAFCFCGFVTCWKAIVLSVHVYWLQKVIHLYEKENGIVSE